MLAIICVGHQETSLLLNVFHHEKPRLKLEKNIIGVKMAKLLLSVAVSLTFAHRAGLNLPNFSSHV